jgi:hypothetical protein
VVAALQLTSRCSAGAMEGTAQRPCQPSARDRWHTRPWAGSARRAIALTRPATARRRASESKATVTVGECREPDLIAGKDRR